MGQYIIRRLIAMIPTFLLLILTVVVLIRFIPGSAVDLMLTDLRASAVDRQLLKERLGLADPLPVVYAEYVAGVLRGDLGNSLWTQKPVRDTIFDKLPVTIELGIMAISMGTFIGIALGVVSAVRQDTWADYGLRSISILFLSVPSFVLGTALVVLPSIYFGWLPPLFFKDFAADPWGHISQFLLPAAILSVGLSASLTRLTRTMMLEVLRQDYVRTARAKGLSDRIVVYRHALKNALIPVITLLGIQVAILVSGTVVVETIFGLPGVGTLLLDSLSQRDYPLIQGVTVVLGIWIMLVNLVVDVLYGVIDPRIRLGSS